MTHIQATIRPERATDGDAIDQLVQRVFGPGMKARAAYALREGRAHEIWCSFVAERDDTIIGTVRLTPIRVGDTRILMLGPLAVDANFKDLGLGRSLMRAAIDTAGRDIAHHGFKAVLLVGDLAYYQQFGFRQVPPGGILMPRPVDPQRVLICELKKGFAETVHGIARRD